MFKETENQDSGYELPPKYRSQSADQNYRMKSKSAGQASNAHKKRTATPGGTRLRRNKHWSW